MGRRKAKPRRSVQILGKQVTIDDDNDNLEEAIDASVQRNREEDGSLPAARAYYFVDVDRSNWDADEHRDISEMSLANLRVVSLLNGDDYLESSYGLRFRFGDENNKYADRMKVGHWPVLSVADVFLEIVRAAMVDGVEKYGVVASGNFDGPDEGVSGLVHLVSLKFLTLRPLSGVRLSGDVGSITLRVEILQRAFDAGGSLLDVGRQVWKKSMMNVMEWLRPEVTTPEARYGGSMSNGVDIHSEVDNDAHKFPRFDVARFYEAIQPSM
ncbi:hypothetical protein Dimus_005704 [Dionaea muscipula]